MGTQLTAHDIALFYDNNYSDFLKFFSKATDSCTIAQDLIQTLFDRILRKATSINNLNGYAWSAARNLVKDYYRSKSHQPETTTYYECTHLTILYPRDQTSDLIDSRTDTEIDFILAFHEFERKRRLFMETDAYGYSTKPIGFNVQHIMEQIMSSITTDTTNKKKYMRRIKRILDLYDLTTAVISKDVAIDHHTLLLCCVDAIRDLPNNTRGYTRMSHALRLYSTRTDS